MFQCSIKKIAGLSLVVITAALLSTLSTGCSPNGGGAKDTVYINEGRIDTIIVSADTVYIIKKDTTYINGGGGSGGGKPLFWIGTWRDTSNGTYSVKLYRIAVYPLPKILVNGFETDDNGYSYAYAELVKSGIPAGNLTYSVIWDGDTLTRTLNLPSNTYRLVKESTETDYRYSIAGYNGDEKVIWRTHDSQYNYINDTLQANKEFVFPKDYRFSSCYIMHKDFKPLTFGYSATAESKKFAVYEEIELWRFSY